MLAAKNRFHGYGSLRKVYSSGNNVRSSLFGLKFYSRDNNKPYRVSVVVGRKVNKSAVVRNRIRRVIYEAVRNSPNLYDSIDLVFIVYSDKIIETQTKEVQDIVNELLKKTKQLTNK
jgi:ribonuclease P protein component